MRKGFLIAVFLLTPFLLPYPADGVGFNKDLFFGVRDKKDVSALQNFLKEEGLYQGPVTGNFFSLTREAVKKFQQREGISPAAGYVGRKTRTRINELSLLKRKGEALSESPQDARSALAEQIVELQKRLAELQEKLRRESLGQVSATPSDITPPVFTALPSVAKKGFIENSPFGERYPYEVVFEWSHDETGSFEESITCSPAVKSEKGASLRLARYFPDTNTSYSCVVSVKDAAGNTASGDVSFSSPPWVSVSGTAVSPFPAVATTPLKLGDMTFYNGSTSAVTFIRLDLLVSDEMDSTFNRNRKVFVLIKDGKMAEDPLIAKSEFTFLLSQPRLGEPHRLPLSLPLSIELKSGAEKTVSMWIELLDFVTSGTLAFTSTAIPATPSLEVRGGINFSLTKAPPL